MKGRKQKRGEVRKYRKQSGRESVYKMCKPDEAQIEQAVAESRANYNKRLNAVFHVLVKQFIAIKVEMFVITTGVIFESERAYWPDGNAGDQYSNKWLQQQSQHNDAVVASPDRIKMLAAVEKPALNSKIDAVMVRKILDGQCIDLTMMQTSMNDLLHKIRVVWPREEEEEIMLKKKSKSLPPLVPLSSISKSIVDKIGANSHETREESQTNSNLISSSFADDGEPDQYTTGISSEMDTTEMHVDNDGGSGAVLEEDGDKKDVLNTSAKTKTVAKRKKESLFTFSCGICGVNNHAKMYVWIKNKFLLKDLPENRPRR